MFIPPTGPMRSNDHKYWEMEAQYKREQAQRGDLFSNLWVSLIELVKLMARLLWLPVRFAMYCKRKFASRNVTR